MSIDLVGHTPETMTPGPPLQQSLAGFKAAIGMPERLHPRLKARGPPIPKKRPILGRPEIPPFHVLARSHSFPERSSQRHGVEEPIRGSSSSFSAMLQEEIIVIRFGTR